jgi:hypothetical protein
MQFCCGWIQRLERKCCLLRQGPVALCYLPIEGSDVGVRFSPEYKYARVYVVSVVTACHIVIGGGRYHGVSCCLHTRHVRVTSSKQKLNMPRCLVQEPLRGVLVKSLILCHWPGFGE